MKRLIKHIWPLFFIVLIVSVYFWSLFFPEPKLFFTSESLGTDLRANYYPGKYFLASSLRKGELPFWSKDIGTGFPLLAEGQIGTFYVFNLLYLLLPTWLAWNLNYVLAFLLALLGSFLFFRKLGLTDRASLFSAFSFAFSGSFISRIIHTSPLQAMSLMPWLFLTAKNFWEKPTKWHGATFALVLAEQIFTGGFQWVFISLLGVFLFFLTQFREERKGDLPRKMSLLMVAVVGAAMIAAPQLLPTWEMRQESQRKTGLQQEEIFFFPYGYEDFITFVLPNYFGTPKEGTYLLPLKVYWENTAYLGLSPLLFLVMAVVQKKKSSWQWSFLFLGVFTALLATGTKSPFYFLLTLPGFNNFRVPSRFLLLTAFSICGLAGAGLDWFLSTISRKLKSTLMLGIVFCLVFALQIGDLFHFDWSYHPLLSVEEALRIPETAKVIQPDERIYTHPQLIKIWKDVFFTRGWQDTLPFLYFHNGLFANLNLVFERANARAYAGLYPERFFLSYDLAPYLFNTLAVDIIISPIELPDSTDFELSLRVHSPRNDLPDFFVYHNRGSLGRFRFVSSYTVVSNLDEAKTVVEKGDYPFDRSAILENDLGENFQELTKSDMTVVEDADQHLVLQTSTDMKALLLVADSYYPAWKAWIDGQPTEILPANINQRAVVVPAGEHEIVMQFISTSFLHGIFLSGLAVVIFVLGNLINRFRFFRRS